MSLPNNLPSVAGSRGRRLGGDLPVQVDVFGRHLGQGPVSTAWTSACTLASNFSGGSGWAPMLGSHRRLPRINADRSWLGKTPCGLFVMASFATVAVGSGQKMGLARWAGWAGTAGLRFGQKMVRLAVKPELFSGDRVILVTVRGIGHREGADHPLLADGARLAKAVG